MGNQSVYTTLQLNGSLLDFGGQAQYVNRTRRLAWGGYISHTSQLGIAANFATTTFNDGTTSVPGVVVTQLMQRQFVQDGRGLLQFPLSATRRLEFDAGVERVSFRLDADSLFVVGQEVVGERKHRLPAPDPLTFGSATLALVGDYSFTGFTSPIAGGRYRFSVSPYVGSLKYVAAMLDYRRYFFRQPFTLAVRGLHYGRYGADADNPLLQPVFLGQSMLVRGYGAESFRADECATTNGSTQSDCPEFDRLSGSKIGVVSAELRIPLLGSDRLGLINFPYIPTEIAPFVDAGVAWNAGSSPVLKFSQRTAERVPVVSAGIAARFNVFGALIVEVNYSRPLQRPGRGNVFGFQLAPGW